MAAAVASASVGNSVTADAVAGALAHGKKSGSGKPDFSDALNAILSSQTVQPQAPTTQDNTPTHKQLALAQVTDALNASTAANGDSTDDSADAIPALAAKITGANTLNTNPAPTTGTNPPAANTPQTISSKTPTAPNVATPSMTQAALTAATQAKLVSALAQAANAHAKIVGSDGTTAASSSSNGTPATADTQTAQTQPAPSETPAATANILAAMQVAQPVVTTVAANADKTVATVTPRTMTQLSKAALGNTAQQALHSAAPAAKTEVQALSIPADATSANAQNGGTQTGSGQKQSYDSNSASLAADADKSSGAQQATLADIPKPTPPPVAQTVANVETANTAATNAASAIGSSAAVPATPPTTIATTLQIAQQTSPASTASPDLNALAVSIAAKSKDGQNEFNIRMDPAELGRVDVLISIDAAGKAQAHLTAEKPQTLELLQRDSSTLQSSLKDSGLDLSNNGLNFSLKGQQQNSTPTFVARNRALSIASVQTTDTTSSTSSTSTAPGDSRLDIRV